MKTPWMRWDWYRDDNAAARAVCVSFAAMFCGGLLYPSPWLAQAIGYFFLIPSAVWFIVQQRGDRWKAGMNMRAAYWLIVAGLACYLAVLLAATFAPINDYLPVQKPIKQLRGVLVCLVSVAAIGAAARHFSGFPKLLGRSLVASAFVAAAVLLAMNYFQGTLGTTRLIGFPSVNWVLNPNAVGAVYAACFAVAIGHMLHRGLTSVERAGALVAVLLILSVILLTASRGAMLGGFAAMGIAVLVLSRRLAAAMVLLVALSGLVLFLLYPDWVMTLIERGDANRIATWKHHLALGMEQPWLGRGLNFDIKFVLGDVIPTFQRPQDLLHPLPLQGIELIYTPHNIVMGAFVRGGVLAVVPQLLVWAVALWSCIGVARAGWYVPLMLVATTFTVCMVDHEMLPGSFSYYWYLFWLPLGVAAAAANGAGRRQDNAQPEGLRFGGREGMPTR